MVKLFKGKELIIRKLWRVVVFIGVGGFEDFGRGW